MFRLLFPCTYTYTHISNIKNRERMYSLSFNGLVEMKKTKCLREITTIYYKWNILLVSNVVVEIMFRWINIMSSYFFFFLYVFIYCLMSDILHCHQSHLHFLPTTQKFIIIKIVFSHYTSPYHKKASWLCLSIQYEDKRCAKNEKEIFKLDKHKLCWTREREREKDEKFNECHQTTSRSRYANIISMRLVLLVIRSVDSMIVH